MQVQSLPVDGHIHTARQPPVAVLAVIQNLNAQRVLQMHPNLVRLSRVQSALQKHNRPLSRQHRVSRNGNIARAVHLLWEGL